MSEILNSIIEQFNNHKITLERMVFLQLVLGFILLVYYLLGKRLLFYFYEKGTLSEVDKKKLRRILRFGFFLLAGLCGVLILGLNIGVPNASSTLNVVNVLLALIIIQIARLFDYFFGRMVNSFYEDVEEEEDRSFNEYNIQSHPQQTASTTLRYAIYTFAVILILKNFQIDYELFSFNAGGNTFHFRISSIFSAILILLVARLLVWALTQIFLSTYYQTRKVDVGSQYAIKQLISYVIYIIAAVMALDNMGVQMTVLWGGLAALLVGVGLGLQQTFNDLFSGLLLLFERTVEVGDMVEIDGEIGNVKKIGLRTSLVESRDNVTMIIPNSKLVMDSIVNWTHYDSKVRFKIAIGVAYGSDTALVKSLLLQAIESTRALKRPSPFVRFVDFGNSSLDFELLFYSRNFVGINDLKSDIRFEIDRFCRENNIEIPFPQTDVWIRNQS